MSRKNVLILCTGNSARSVMGEAAFNVHGGDRYQAFSAGSTPTGKVNPFAIEQTEKMGYDSSRLRSKSWDEFSGEGAPEMDLVITVCSNAANETCPYWPGAPLRAHWGFEDPADAQGTDAEKRAVFDTICQQILQRVHAFLAVDTSGMSQQDIQAKLDEIGNMPV